MFEVMSEIDIPASPRQVWSALVDFPNYRNWNPYVQIRGAAASGSAIEWSLGSTVLKKRIWMTALITEFDEPLALAWSFGSRGIFTVEECFSLEGIAAGTRLQHKARCSGLGATLGRNYMRKKIENIVTTADRYLSRYFERRAVSSKTIVLPRKAARSPGEKKRRQTRRRRK